MIITIFFALSILFLPLFFILDTFLVVKEEAFIEMFWDSFVLPDAVFSDPCFLTVDVWFGC